MRPELERYAPLERTAEAIAGNARTPYAATAALMAWFRTNGGFVYTNRPPSSGSTAPLVDFVTRTHAGYCQHFAGAMALMLRYLGVPARVAVGFSSGVYDAKNGVWRVTDHDAHAWVEVWFRGYGWLPFDPTPAARPGRGQLSAPYAAAVAGRCVRRPPARGRAVGVGPTDPRQAGHHHGETEGTGVHGAGSRPLGPRASSHGSLLLLLALLLGGAFAAIVVAKIAVRRGRYLTRDPRRLAAACRRELADYLVDQNIDAARSATLHELGSLVRHELAVETDAFVAAATAARFGPPAGAARAAQRRPARAADAHPRHAHAHAYARSSPRHRFAALVRVRRLMDAVVMAAGEGSRLRPLTEQWPKPVLPIDGRPVIATLLRELASAGCERAFVVTGHLAEQVEELVGDGSGFSLEVTVRAAARRARIG